jgi:hypothetical protein
MCTMSPGVYSRESNLGMDMVQQYSYIIGPRPNTTHNQIRE